MQLINPVNIPFDKTCCFTGHRPQKLPWGFNENDERCLNMKKRAEEEIEKAINEGYILFISGMALGFDMTCAEIVLKLSEKYKDVKLMCSLPCSTQSALWPMSQKQRHAEILKKSYIYRCKNNNYVKGCMQERNRNMVDLSSKVIALYDGSSGGTEYTINYAKKKGLDIVILKP